MISNNDILRRLRYAFDLNDDTVISIFALGKHTTTRSEISNWLKKEDDDQFTAINDLHLINFLNGFIVHKRGEKEGAKPLVEDQLNNNVILRKLRIALNLKDVDMLEILAKSDIHISKHELSAFFRKPHQNQYRPCQDQILRNFINGVQLTYRPAGK